jgi:hypothetical protein
MDSRRDPQISRTGERIPGWGVFMDGSLVEGRCDADMIRRTAATITTVVTRNPQEFQSASSQGRASTTRIVTRRW